MTTTRRAKRCSLLVVVLGLALATPTQAQDLSSAAGDDPWPGLPRRPLQMRLSSPRLLVTGLDARGCPLPRGAFDDQLETRARESLRAIDSGLSPDIVPFELFATALDLECTGRPSSASALFRQAAHAALALLANCPADCDRLVRVRAAAQVGMGVNATRQQDWDSAISYFTTVLDDPRLRDSAYAAVRIDALSDLAYAYELLHRFGEARRAYERIAREASDLEVRPFAAYRAALMSLRSGNTRVGVRALQSFVSAHVDPSSLELRAQAMWEIWQTLERLGRRRDARRARDALLALDTSAFLPYSEGARWVADAELSVVTERVDAFQGELRISLRPGADSAQDLATQYRAAVDRVFEIARPFGRAQTELNTRAAVLFHRGRALEFLADALASAAPAPEEAGRIMSDAGGLPTSIERAEHDARCRSAHLYAHAYEAAHISLRDDAGAGARLAAIDPRWLYPCLAEEPDDEGSMIPFAMQVSARPPTRRGLVLDDVHHAPPALARAE